MSMKKIFLINIKYHGHDEKGRCEFAFSYPCWWIMKGDEIVIKEKKI
jgi:hypothetical protein